MECFLILEIGSKKVNGRRTAKFVLHEIFADDTAWQENGVSWKEEYTSKNLSTVQNMSVTAEFIDGEKREPLGHGFTGVNEKGNPEFLDAVVVGHASDPKIETVEINGRPTRVLTATAHLDEMRYPKFIEWLFEQHNGGKGVKGSVEIVGNTPGSEINYEDGWKEQGRVPKDYSYSGFAFLTVKEADPSAVVLELSNKINKNQNQNQTEENSMDENKIMSKFEEILNKISKEADEKNGKNIAEINEKVEKLTKEITEKDAKIAELNEKLAAAEKDALIAEFNNAVANFTDAQKEPAKDQIAKFMANPAKTEINNIVATIKCAIADKVIADAKKTGEQNAKKTPQNTLTDIYCSMDDPAKKEDEGGLF